MTNEQAINLRLKLATMTVTAIEQYPMRESQFEQAHNDLLALIDQAKQPQSDEVKGAIEWFTDRSCSSVYMDGNVIPSFRKCKHETLLTIETALRQMAAEPKPTIITDMNDGFNEVCPTCGANACQKYQHYCNQCGQWFW